MCLSNTLVAPQGAESGCFFEIPSNSLLVFQTQNGRIVDLVDVRRKCSGRNASDIRFNQGPEVKWDQVGFLQKLEGVMVEAVRKRVQNIPGIAHSENS